jgi:hypothetical protein
LGEVKAGETLVPNCGGKSELRHDSLVGNSERLLREHVSQHTDAATLLASIPQCARSRNMSKFFASRAVLVASLLAATPAFAFTHHPATPAEKAQTRDLNLQQLAVAQGHAPGNMQANTGAAPAGATNEGAAPAEQNAAPAPNAPAAPQSSDQPAPQTPQTNEAPAAPQPQSPQQ